MKSLVTLFLILRVPLAGPALADSQATAALADGCELVGPIAEATEDWVAAR